MSFTSSSDSSRKICGGNSDSERALHLSSNIIVKKSALPMLLNWFRPVICGMLSQIFRLLAFRHVNECGADIDRTKTSLGSSIVCRLNISLFCRCNWAGIMLGGELGECWFSEAWRVIRRFCEQACEKSGFLVMWWWWFRLLFKILFKHLSSKQLYD